MKIVKKYKLTEEIIYRLGETLDGYDEYFKTAIEKNICELWEINNGDSYAITRLENDPFKQHPILVVCCYKGKDLKPFVEHIKTIADKNKWFIRFHTFRPALARWMNRDFNFNEKEYILYRSPE